MKCTGLREPLVFTLALFAGTFISLISKMLYEFSIPSAQITGHPDYFQYPIFLTCTMFLSMSFALPLHFVSVRFMKFQTDLSLGTTSGQPISLKLLMILIFPSAFDLIATYMANVGLLYVTASVFQLMKCTVIVFVALVKVCLNDRFSMYMWVGVLVNTLAVVLVGLSSLISSPTNSSASGDTSPIVGITFIVCSCFVQALQYVFEEKLMTGLDAVPPLFIVGMEGMWGFLLTTLVVYPLSSISSQPEYLSDAITMLVSSGLIQSLVVFYMVSILVYNILAVYITYILSSVWHAILDNFRPTGVWGAGLFLFTITHGSFGESWGASSWLQLLGSCFLLVGTLIYNGTLRLPGFEYPLASDELEFPMLVETLVDSEPAIHRDTLGIKHGYSLLCDDVLR